MPSSAHAHPVLELLDSLISLATAGTSVPSTSSTPAPVPASVPSTRPPTTPIVDLDSTPISAPSDDDVTVVRDSRSAPPSQDDDEIEIVSAAFVTVPGAPPINLDVDVAECSPAPATAPVIDVPEDSQDPDQIEPQQPIHVGVLDFADVDTSDDSPEPQLEPQLDSVIDVEAEPEDLVSDDEVVVCPAPLRRPRTASACDACNTSLRGAPPLAISRCKHGLCARCALRSVVVVDKLGAEEGPDLVASMLRPLATCVAPRCRAPLSRAEVDAAMAVPVVDDAFAIALAVFHSWRGSDEAEESGTGAALIEFPAFSAEMMPVMVDNGVLQGVEQLVDDDVATACEPLWVLDEEAAAGRGAWICAACGRYDNLSTATVERAESPEEDAIDVDDEMQTEFPDAPLPPAYPHCPHARALGVYENIKGFARVWEDEKEAVERRKEEEKAKEKEAEAAAKDDKSKDRKRRSSRKRYTSASTVRSAKRRKTTKKTGFAKGTGYAGSSGSEWKGPSEKLLDEAARLDAEATYWLIRLRCFLLSPSDAHLESWPGFMRVLLRERRLVAHLAKILINESIMDVLGRIPVFYAALRVVHTLTESPSLRVLVTEPTDGDKGRSIAELVESLSRQAALLSTGAGREGLPESTSFLIKQIRKCIRVINRHNLLQAVRNRNVAVCTVDLDEVEDGAEVEAETTVADGTASKRKETGQGALAGSGCFSFEQDQKMYIEKMKTHQFQAVPGLANTSVFYPEAMRAEQAAAVQGKRQRRIASEVASLFSSLPLSWSSTILLRVDEDRYDFLRACIFGPDGTPYDSGAFVFDIFLPLGYPNVPPKFRLLTTGGGRVRFNPNLYNTGKVCLSLLGTWSGPSWTSASTILQVLVSIQSLILVPDPYFNEPGYERNVGTASGKEASAQYNERVRLDTALYAIHANIRHPTPDLEAGILAHFQLKRRYLTYKLRKWFPMLPKQLVAGSDAAEMAQVGQNGTSAHMVVSADPTTALSNLTNLPIPSLNGTSGLHQQAPIADQPGATPTTFGPGRNFRAPEMSSTNLERIISDLESIPP